MLAQLGWTTTFVELEATAGVFGLSKLNGVRFLDSCSFCHIQEKSLAHEHCDRQRVVNCIDGKVLTQGLMLDLHWLRWIRAVGAESLRCRPSSPLYSMLYLSDVNPPASFLLAPLQKLCCCY